MIRLLLLILLLAPVLSAQGVLTGKLYDAAGGDEYLDDAAMIGAVALPADSPPFNELTATQWQEAMTALSAALPVEVPLGGVIAPVTPTDSFFKEIEGDGSFRLEGLPLNTRLGIAAKVGDVWWPLRSEVRFTESTPQEVRIPYYRLGADPAGVKILTYMLEAGSSLRADLRYGPITVFETLRFTNTDSAFAAMVKVELSVMVPPGMSSAKLPEMYGSQLMYMQGWNATPPAELAHNQDAANAWTFGVGRGMHGERPTFGPQAQATPDNWHQWNGDPMLAMVGAGNTTYRVERSASGRAATLIFERPVPPARDGVPGVLEIRLLHSGGVLTSMPTGKIALERRFDYSVLEAQAAISPELTLAALVTGAHRRLYGQPTAEGMQRFPSNPDVVPVLGIGEDAQIVLGFGPEAQEQMKQLEARATGEPVPMPEAPEDATTEPKLDQQVLFLSLAVVFGLAFIGALIATVRLPRDKQLKRLGELPGSRREVIEAVSALEKDYKEGALPAREYQTQRQRLLNRLVEFDSREDEPGTKPDDKD